MSEKPEHYQGEDGRDLWETLRPRVGGQALIEHWRINAFEYLDRYRQKGGVADLRKAKANIERMIQEIVQHG